MIHIPRFEVATASNAAFVIDRPARQDPGPHSLDIRVIASCGSDFALAQELADAWNAVVDKHERGK
jgi:hypothetical protein